ncbi:MAG TPA: hypothetical protein VGC36_17000 [Rhizomicrobium sp.]
MVSLPVRVHPANVPHLVLIAVVVLAAATDMVMSTVSWIAGV